MSSLCFRHGISGQATSTISFLFPRCDANFLLQFDAPTHFQSCEDLTNACAGGGWVVGDLNSHDAMCQQLASSTGTAVMAVAYRLAPEYPYPVCLNDCLSVVDCVARAGSFYFEPIFAHIYVLFISVFRALAYSCQHHEALPKHCGLHVAQVSRQHHRF